MAYRDEKIGTETQLVKCQEAKAMLEELADSNRLYLSEELHTAVTAIGFKPEDDLFRLCIVYSREREGLREILATGDLSTVPIETEKKLYLHQMPIEQKIMDFYSQLSYRRDLAAQKSVFETIFSGSAALAGIIPTAVFFAHNLYLYGTIAAIFTIANGTKCYRSLSNRNVASGITGADALRYIKNNTADETPPLHKVQVIDAEFTEE
ncbi:MAG TPA: hypothetical protein VJA18_03705 [Candidatus Nanoarchaeia archaeon]|nr:hypothetical protein [Candidatus Nanoarchaeia archaeon]